MCRLVLIAAFIALTATAQTSSTSLLGHWREPTGSVIETFRCGAEICARVAAVSKQAPSQFDIYNPNPAARKHPLCGLQVGSGFHPDGDNAEDGHLYDAKSGKTYRGSMSVEGDQLHLRGYIGIKAFGKSQTWTRVSGNFTPCKP